MQNTLQSVFWTSTNVTIVTLNWRTTVYWRGIQTILMVKGAKGKTNDSFGSQMAREFLPLSVSVSKTHARLFSVEKE